MSITPDSEHRTAAGSGATALCVLLALLAWLPSCFRSGFAMDDRELLLENPVVDGALPIFAAFDRDYFHHLGDAGQWRPLATLSFRAEHALWSALGVADRSWPWHLGNTLLHALVVGLAGALLLSSAWRARPLPWFGLALFAVHPALADAVAWISGRTSIVSAAAGLIGALGVRAALRAGRERTAAFVAGLGVLAALAGKEDGVVFAVMYALLGLSRSRRSAARVAIGAGVGLCAGLILRGLALGQALPTASTPVLPDADLWERAQLGGAALIEALRLAVAPFGYPPQYRADFLLERAAPLDPGLVALLGWALYFVAIMLALTRLVRGAGRLAGSALLCALSIAPVLQLVPIGEAFAPRFLYLPLLCGIPLAHALWRRLPLRNACAVALLALCVAGAWQRSGVYASRGSYRRAVLEYMPNDAPSWNDLGLALEEEDRLDAAHAAWARAVELDPGYSRGWSNLGRSLLEQGREEEAEEHLRRAAAAGPRNPIAQMNLGALMLRRGDATEAIDAYERATSLAPGRAGAWRGLGAARLAAEQTAAAGAALQRALELDPKDERARRLLERARRP